MTPLSEIFKMLSPEQSDALFHPDLFKVYFSEYFPTLKGALEFILLCFLLYFIHRLSLKIQPHKTPKNLFKRLILRGSLRCIFPLLCTLILIAITPLWFPIQHFPLLFIIVCLFSLLFLMIRLSLFFIRSFFPPSLWLKDFERILAFGITLMLVLSDQSYFVLGINSIEKLKFRLGEVEINLLQILEALLLFALLSFIGHSLSSILDKILLKSKKIDPSLSVLFTKVFRILFFALSTLIVLNEVGVKLQMLAVFGGALGVGIGLGLQRLASNYVSGISILLERSIKLGDFISIDKQASGMVNQMTARYMVLKGVDGSESIVPNETLISSTVINHSYSNPEIRLTLPIYLNYNQDLEQSISLIEKIAYSHSEVLSHPEPKVLIKNFGAQHIQVELCVWITQKNTQLSQEVCSEIYFALWKLFQERGMSFPTQAPLV